MSRAFVLLLVWLSVSHASADPRPLVPRRKVGLHWQAAVPRVTFHARDLMSPVVRNKLRSGLPQTLTMRLYIYPRRAQRPVAVYARSCRVTYDLWQEVYRLEIESVRGKQTLVLPRLNAVADRCLVARHVPIGAARQYQKLRGRELYLAALVELNPLSADMVLQMRAWLSRSRVGSGLDGQAFFGSFVSLFVNRHIDQAERTVRFRSQIFRVP